MGGKRQTNSTRKDIIGIKPLKKETTASPLNPAQVP